jgi:hypothetical protein
MEMNPFSKAYRCAAGVRGRSQSGQDELQARIRQPAGQSQPPRSCFIDMALISSFHA